MENWSFPDHKSDFKADQKIRKAMFSAEEGVVRDLGGDSRRDRILLTLSLRLHAGRGHAGFFFILNPFSSQSCHPRSERSDLATVEVEERALGIGFTAISTCIDPQRSRSRALLRESNSVAPRAVRIPLRTVILFRRSGIRFFEAIRGSKCFSIP